VFFVLGPSVREVRSTRARAQAYVHVERALPEAPAGALLNRSNREIGVGPGFPSMRMTNKTDICA
jgi:hypothetical protein